MQQGSYLLIQPGMSVEGNDGVLGSVASVVADTESDVFRGIVLSQGRMVVHYCFIASDHVVSVVGNQVRVNIAIKDVGNLPPVSAGTVTPEGKEIVT